MRIVLVSIALVLAACSGTPAPLDAGSDAGSAPDAGPRDWPFAEVPAVTEPEPGIRREVLEIDVSDAPANPTTGDDTPSELDRIRIVRFSAEGMADVRAVIVAMPGLLGGGGSWEMLARHLVRRSIDAGEPVEVWAIDRRSNLLEDLRGLDAAEASEDFEIARGYYLHGETVGGEAFAGFVDQEDVPFMSEWGLATHMADLRAVIDHVPSEHQKARVFLMGHSLGGSMTEAFGAWRFEDGARGAELVAGLVLVDGAASTTAISEAEYREGTSGGIMSLPGVDAIRSSQRYLALPLLGVEVHVLAEISAMMALYAPEEVVDDRERATVLATLMSLTPRSVPAMSNAAAFGWAFDDASNGLSFAAVSMGQSTGGATEEYESLFGTTLIRPSDPSATYTWIDALDADPPEHTPLANLAHAWIDGRTNFAEWYFPLRLPLDLSAVGGLAIAEDGWQASEGLRAFDGAAVDAPILAIAAGLVSPDRYEPIRTRVAPVGADRPNAGATRDLESAFRVVDVTDQTHIDPLSAADTDRNPVPEAILEFVLANAQPGRVVITLP